VTDDDRGRAVRARDDLREGRADGEGHSVVQLLRHEAANVIRLDEF
jgi:hypothetical protein